MDRIEQRLANFAPTSPPEALRRHIVRSAERNSRELGRLWSTLQWAVVAVLVTYSASLVSENQQRSRLSELQTQARAKIDAGQTAGTLRQQVSEVLEASEETELTNYFVAQVEQARNRRSSTLRSAGQWSIWSEEIERNWQ